MKKILIALFFISIQVFAQSNWNVSSGSSVLSSLIQIYNYNDYSINEISDFNIPNTDLGVAGVGNPQGVCTDGTNIFVSYRNHIYKYDMIGTPVTDVATTQGTYADDNGGCCVVGNYLYLVNCNARYSGTNGAVSKYAKSNLAYDSEVILTTPSAIPLSISYKDDSFWIAWNTNILTKYSTSFVKIADYTIPISLIYYEGSIWMGNIFIGNEHEDGSGTVKWGYTDLLYFDGTTFSFITTIKRYDLWGQGFDYYNGILYIAKRGYLKSKNKIISTKLEPAGIKPAARTWLKTNQTGIVTSAWTKVAFDTTTFDYLDDVDKVNNRFVAPVTGYYRLSYSPTWLNSTVVANKRYTSWVQINGSITTPTTGSNIHSALIDYLSSPGSCIVYMKAGDYVELFVKSESGQNSSLQGGETATFMDVSLIK
jgi:hypothetical protein